MNYEEKSNGKVSRRQFIGRKAAALPSSARVPYTSTESVPIRSVACGLISLIASFL
ncbi:MAG: hypothetical protein ACYDA9_18535 [Terriglobia bacterium]